MTDGLSLINLGELTKPATVLLEKVATAIGVYYEPIHTIKMAKAKANAEVIKTTNEIKISNIRNRAINRVRQDEIRNQNNIEQITKKALPYINEDAQPQKIKDEWISIFFSKCKFTSDEEMQLLWSKILAGEANIPGSFSKRTINLLGSFDKNDALIFHNLCAFCWKIEDIQPFIYDPNAEIYTKYDVNFNTLMHLDKIGLVNYSDEGYEITNIPKTISLDYYGRKVQLELNYDLNILKVGKVLLSKTGQEIALLCNPNPIPEFFEFMMERWKMVFN